jgi:hypothetical protein
LSEAPVCVETFELVHTHARALIDACTPHTRVRICTPTYAHIRIRTNIHTRIYLPSRTHECISNTHALTYAGTHALCLI